MTSDLSAIRFFYAADGARRPETMDELVAAWIARTTTMIAYRTQGTQETIEQYTHDPNRWSWHAADELCDDHPDVAMAFILAVIASGASRDVLYLLASGPLTDLLAKHGDAFIDIVEQEARHDAKFKHMVGAVWQGTMPDAVWVRVERAQQGD